MKATDEQRCEEAVVALHRTIEAWLTGRAAREPEVFATFADAHASGFTMVTPDGVLLGRDELLAGFEAAHGSAPGLTVRITDVTVLRSGAGSVAATYLEHQDGSSGSSTRRATVLFDRDEAAATGLRSRHLHETWTAGG